MAGLEPFTVEHFERWASEIVLDNDETWQLEPFQISFVQDLFEGRRINWLVIPEGNGKTTLVAGLGLYYCEMKPYSTVLAAAAAVDQATIMYQQAEGMVLRTPRLRELKVSDVLVAKGKKSVDKPYFECLEGWRRINCVNGSRFQIKPADAITGDGVIPNVCFVDELHRHPDLALYRTWAGKLRKRGGTMVVISTAGEPGGEFETTRQGMHGSALERSRADCFVRAVGDTWVLHDWAVPENSDVTDLELVARANPLSYVTPETLAETWATPGMTLQHWSRINCNIPTRSVSAAITDVEWDAALTDELIPEGQPVAAGLDVAWKWDTTALVPLWCRDDDFRLLGDATILVPPRDGSSLDSSLVEKAILDLHKRNPLHTVVMDTTRAEQLAEWISTTIGAMVIDRSQGNAMQAEDYERFMDALRNGKIRHTGDPGLRKHAFNAVTKVLPDGKARFDRQKQSRTSEMQDDRVIDALVAAAMVHTEVAGSGPGGVYYG